MSTYTPIASVNVNGFTTVTFNNISSNFTDLIVVGSGLTRGTANSVFVRFNGDSGSNYSYTQLVGNGSTASSSRASNQTGGMVGAGTSGLSSTPTMFICQVQNYGNSTTNKTYLSRDTDSNGSTEAFVGLWRSTAAITSVTVYTGGDFTGGQINLYGVANASITNVAKATGGDSVYTDGTYWYHIFRSSGTFTPTQALTADYLVVAGGGSGGANSRGAGGGAGGMRCTVTATGGGGTLESALSLTANTGYTVTVGAGGTGSAGAKGTNGSDSVFSTITSTGGGAGGSRASTNGETGGSGGGAATGAGGTPGTAGSGTANQGYAGGAGAGTGVFGTGGGGGAGAVGGAGTSTTAGNGGAGVATSISGSSVTYAGGGGGTSDTVTGTGTNGGGNGASGAAGGNGTANTGGGGGATNSSTFAGGNGGSGIVIIRYSAAAQEGNLNGN